MELQRLEIDQFDYVLPQDRVPDHPLAQRDQAALLVYREGQISDLKFRNLPDLLKPGDQLFLNDTKVIPARLLFRRPTGALIEIFCLNAYNAATQEAMGNCGSSDWECLVGGVKKWKDPVLTSNIEVHGRNVQLTARRGIELGDGRYAIHFQWDAIDWPFSDILEMFGKIPLPPYFRRDPQESDYDRYQTVFARSKGSVAAPTAALHFTPEVLGQLQLNGVNIQHLTLHVGIGTFRPVSTASLRNHSMHAEWFSISSELIRDLALQSGPRRIAVGTTSLRSLESLYWLGVKLLSQTAEESRFSLGQWEYAELPQNISLGESMGALLNWLNERGLNEINADTSILIAPGYQFRVVDGLVTNFHLPKSTLIALVAAFVGEPWRKIYDHALLNGYRFLSYGDSSLLFRDT